MGQKLIKIATIIGARPQFIKAAMLSREIKKNSQLKEIIIHTGQHFDLNMSDIFFEEMEIPHPNYKLEINSLSHGAMTGRMLEKIEDILINEKPDWVLVYGDTNTTLAGALAAKKLHIKIMHVESGLRSFNMAMPEEINRVLTDRISDVLCCPTDTAMRNLEKEGFKSSNSKVVLTGDVMKDAVMYYSQFSAERSKIINNMKLSEKDFVICTIHREENTDDLSRLQNIFEALHEISQEMTVVLPLHPRTQKILNSELPEIKTQNSKLKTIPPIGYFDMLELLKHCKLVMTDSGGLQKEACFFSKPCLTIRDETEWVELVDAGVNCIVGTGKSKIISGFKTMLSRQINFKLNLYGEGDASKKIIEVLKDNKSKVVL